MADSPPILIVGAGLAGLTLAWELHARTVPFLLVDPQREGTSSRVAAGIVNPITGPRLRLTWRAQEMLEVMRPFYASIATALGHDHFHPRPLLRLLTSADQANVLEKRLQDPLYAPFIASHGLGAPASLPHLSDVRAWYQTGHSGFLNTRSFLSDSWAFFTEQGQTQQAAPAEQELEPQEDGTVRWGQRTFRAAILCTGIDAMNGRFFGDLPFRPAKGETLTLESAEPSSEQLLNRSGKWLLPSPCTTKQFRAGSTYDWQPEHADPTDAGGAEIAAALDTLLNDPYTIIEHEAAIRPVIAGHRPVAGRHPEYSGIACLNGLGSKGVLYVPYAAKQLLGHLLDDLPLDPEIDARRNF